MGRFHRLKGQAAIEFLIVVPFLFVLVFVAIDLSRVVIASGQAQAVASDTARWCATQRTALQMVDDASAITHARESGQLASGSNVSLSQEEMSPLAHDYTMHLLTNDGATDKTIPVKAKREKITVEVTIPVKPLFPVFFGVGWSGTYSVTGKSVTFATVGKEL